MWGNFGSLSEKARELAKKAQDAARDLDKQLNESVGIETPTAPPAFPSSTPESDDDDGAFLNDAWDDDDDAFQEIAADSPSSDAAPATPIAAATPPEQRQAVEAPPPMGGEGTISKEQNALVANQASQPLDLPSSEEPVVEEEDGWKENEDLVLTSSDLDNTTDLKQEQQQEEPSQKASSEPLPQPSVTEEQTTTTASTDSSLPLETAAVAKQEEKTPPPTPEPQISNADSGVPEMNGAAEPSQSMDQGDGDWAKEDDDLDLVKSDSMTSNGPSEQQKQFEDNSAEASEISSTIENQTLPVATEEGENAETIRESADTNNNDQPEQQQQEYKEMNLRFEKQLKDVQEQLQQRENQLFSKTEQLTTMQALHEAEKRELQTKIQSTKEEAKRRIQKAKERVEAMEARLKSASEAQSSTAEGAAQQAEIVAALREEGQKLAQKQSEMEQAVRAAKTESRELRIQLEEETSAKNDALQNIEELTADLKLTKENLVSATKGEAQAAKLETDLQEAREETKNKAVQILSLEQNVKEFKQEVKDLKAELVASEKGAAVETEREQKKLLKEHHNIHSDLEAKLQASEREAAVREDALRQEVAELRKRWQDTVRRADSLSMDVQSSTAPLLRQLESTERQNRVRAAAWAELETKLRTELEENVITNEKLSKERTEYKTKYNRLERASKENDEELKTTKIQLEDNTAKVKELEEKLQEMETKGAKMKEEWAEVERLANEGVSRVRSEMTQTVVESEERHRSQLEAVEKELRQEKSKRSQLEEQVDQLVKNAGMLVPATMELNANNDVREMEPKKLRRSQDQVDILTGALNGLGGSDINDDDSAVDEGKDGEREVAGDDEPERNRGSSFAAIEELSSRLKVSTIELTALRKSLEESESTREKLMHELTDCRNAKEKLPLFEAKVKELTEENREQAFEIEGLREDVTEVRELYRTQLNVLLEEKAASIPMKSGKANLVEEEEKAVVTSSESDENPAEVTSESNGV